MHIVYIIRILIHTSALSPLVDTQNIYRKYRHTTMCVKRNWHYCWNVYIHHSDIFSLHMSGLCWNFCTRFSGFLLSLYHAVHVCFCVACLCFCYNIILFSSFSIGLDSVCVCLCSLCFAYARVFCFRIFACWVDIAIHMMVIAAIRQVCRIANAGALVHREILATHSHEIKQKICTSCTLLWLREEKEKATRARDGEERNFFL